jgi:ABC-2 type transport system permease protein
MTTITATVPTVAARPASPLSSWWSDTRVFAARNIRHIREIPEKLLDVTLQPLMFVLLFAYVFGGAIHVSGSNYREYLIGGILVQSLTFGLMGPATTMATDLTEGVIDRFRALPSSRSAYLSGHVLSELAGLTLSVTILLGSGLLVGWRTHTAAPHVLAGLGLLLLFALVMVWGGTLLGLSVRSPDAVMGVGFTVVFPLTFVSNAFVPIESMPAILQHFAAWNPISVMVAAVRELFGNPTAPLTVDSWPMSHPVVASLIYCAIALLIVIPLCLRRYRARTTD